MTISHTIIDAVANSNKEPMEKIRDLTQMYFSAGRGADPRDLGAIVLAIEGIATRELIGARRQDDSGPWLR